jgi:hypothetical protein
MIQDFSFGTAGRLINARGQFFRYETGSSSTKPIRVKADGNDLGLYLPGDSIELPVPASAWEVTPVDPSPNTGTTGTVRVGSGRVSSSRIVIRQDLDGKRDRSRRMESWVSMGFGTIPSSATVPRHWSVLVRNFHDRIGIAVEKIKLKFNNTNTTEFDMLFDFGIRISEIQYQTNYFQTGGSNGHALTMPQGGVDQIGSYLPDPGFQALIDGLYVYLGYYDSTSHFATIKNSLLGFVSRNPRDTWIDFSFDYPIILTPRNGNCTDLTFQFYLPANAVPQTGVGWQFSGYRFPWV